MAHPVHPNSAKLPPDRSGSLSTSVADQLRQTILSGELLPGTRLRLEALKARYQVSLSPLREALLRLAGEGYVVAEDQRGFRVAAVSRHNLEEITVLRCTLEPEALRKSIERADGSWEDQLVIAFHRLAKIERQGGERQLEDWEAAHSTFHLALISGCGMPVMLQFCRTLLNLSDRYRRLFLYRNPHDRSVPDEHRAIYEFALDRNIDDASKLLGSHIARTGRAIASYVATTEKLSDLAAVGSTRGKNSA